MPESVDGIQCNTCRTPGCKNFGIEPLQKVSRGKVKAGDVRIQDGYRRNSKRNSPGLACVHCGGYGQLKSNLAIKEEFDRISAFLRPPAELSCPNAACSAHGRGVYSNRRLYYTDGKTSAGTPRYKCKTCGKRFSERRRHKRQRKSHENRLLFAMLVNKTPLRGIARVCGLAPQTVYDKIRFIHRQCLAFAADRERRLHDGPIPRLYLSVDRQDYLLNWTDRKHKRNTQLTAIAAADNRTGYVFGPHLNYDPDVNRSDVEQDAQENGDRDGRDPSFRRYARLWLGIDYVEAAARSAQRRIARDQREKKKPADGSTVRALQDFYVEQEEAEGDGDAEDLDESKHIPIRGAQVHFEYTVHAFFRLLRHQVGHAGRLRFYLDQDEVLRAACLTTFSEHITARRADVFLVRYNKEMVNDKKRELVARTEKFIAKWQRLYGFRSRFRTMAHLLRYDVMAGKELVLGGRKDKWLGYPFDTMAEPQKAISLLTDFRDFGLSQRTFLFLRASLHGIDRFFMQTRRLLSMLERPLPSRSQQGAFYRGYNPYNPAMVQVLLDIYRTYYNYVAKGADKQTPAMRLGLAQGPLDFEDILYFDEQAALTKRPYVPKARHTVFRRPPKEKPNIRRHYGRKQLLRAMLTEDVMNIPRPEREKRAERKSRGDVESDADTPGASQ